MFGSSLLTLTLLIFNSIFFLPVDPHLDASRGIQNRNSATGRRVALVVGIGNYEIAGFTKLDYPENDVTRMTELLESRRYGFTVHQLTDAGEMKPTRDNIIAAIKKYFIEDAQDGDVLFFYYSGHGSSVRNSLSDEPDKRDETIVPVDAVRPVRKAQSFRDIRDKELAELFNRTLDKKVTLTAIFDSCHSGSISRDSSNSKEGAAVEEDLREAPNGPYQTTKPESRGALVITAAEDRQQAGGGTYTLNGKEAPYSHLTANMLEILYEVPADLISVDVLFQKVTAQMKAEGLSQTPTLYGTPERFEKNLFGGDVGVMSGRIRVAATTSKESFDETKYLQGGLADGIVNGMEFRRIDPGTGKETTPKLTVKIDQAGLSRSSYSIKSGEGQIANGDLFEQATWPSRADSKLRVWLPPATLDEVQMKDAVSRIRALGNDRSLRIISDVTEDAPVNVIQSVEKQGVVSWTMNLVTGKVVDLGPSLDATRVKSSVVQSGTQKTGILINLPPSRELRMALEKRFRAGVGQVSLADSLATAGYTLVGTPSGDGVSYAWVLKTALTDVGTPVSRQAGSGQRKVETSMPRITDSITDGDSTAESLEKLAFKLGTISSFLRLDSPLSIGSGRFPYRFEIRETASKNRLKPNGVLRPKIDYEIVLTLVPSAVSRADFSPVVQFYAYVINLDSSGKGEILEQISVGGTGNIPFDPSNPAKEITLIESMSIAESGTFGTEIYTLIVTTTPIQNPAALFFRGVRNVKQDKTREGSTSLNDFFSGISRRDSKGAEDNWLVEHLIMRSTP